MSKLSTSFELDHVNLSDNLALIAVDGGFCEIVAEALFQYREGNCPTCRDRRSQKPPNKALESMAHQIQQAGKVLNGKDACHFPVLAGKIITEDEGSTVDSCESEKVPA